MYLTTNPILIISAVVPAIFLLVRIYRADKLEPEPVGLLIRLLMLGAVSTFLAVITEWIGTFILDLVFYEDTLIYNLLMYFLVVGCSEEIFKYLLLKKRTWNSPEFDCQFDGVVYAVSVSLGFALWENIGYVASYGFATAIVRAFTAVPGHASFGVFMGAFYGMARRYDNFGYAEESKKCRKLAVLIPVLIHGAYDFIATLESDTSDLIFLGFVGLMFFVTNSMVKKLSRNDRFIRERNDYSVY